MVQYLLDDSLTCCDTYSLMSICVNGAPLRSTLLKRKYDIASQLIWLVQSRLEGAAFLRSQNSENVSCALKMP